MKTPKRRSWLLVILAVLAVSVIAANIVVDLYTRERPNYTRIEDGLWLGGYVPEPPRRTQVVLNLCETPDPYQVAVHKHEPIIDAEPAPSIDWLRQQVEFIANERAKGHIVYVHCRNGVSRSALVMIAYLMQRENWSVEQATTYVKERREVRPNPAFRKLLGEWEQAVKTSP
jgi:hypothetical protein